MVAFARDSAVPVVSATASSYAAAPASLAVVAHARSTPMHVAHNSGGTGGLLPVQRSTSYCLGNLWSDTGRVQGATGRRSTKGGVSRRAEDLRPVSEVEAGLKISGRPAVYGRRLEVHFPEATRHRYQEVREFAVAPSHHPEVPGIQFVSLGYGLDIRQSMGWTKVCGTAQSGIWVLNGNARSRMLPCQS